MLPACVGLLLAFAHPAAGAPDLGRGGDLPAPCVRPPPPPPAPPFLPALVSDAADAPSVQAVGKIDGTSATRPAGSLEAPVTTQFFRRRGSVAAPWGYVTRPDPTKDARILDSYKGLGGGRERVTAWVTDAGVYVRITGVNTSEYAEDHDFGDGTVSRVFQVSNTWARTGNRYELGASWGRELTDFITKWPDKPVHLYGHSWGGVDAADVALAVLKKQPKRKVTMNADASPGLWWQAFGRDLVEHGASLSWRVNPMDTVPASGTLPLSTMIDQARGAGVDVAIVRVDDLTTLERNTGFVRPERTDHHHGDAYREAGQTLVPGDGVIFEMFPSYSGPFWTSTLDFGWANRDANGKLVRKPVSGATAATQSAIQRNLRRTIARGETSLMPSNLSNVDPKSASNAAGRAVRALNTAGDGVDAFANSYGPFFRGQFGY